MLSSSQTSSSAASLVFDSIVPLVESLLTNLSRRRCLARLLLAVLLHQSIADWRFSGACALRKQAAIREHSWRTRHASANFFSALLADIGSIYNVYSLCNPRLQKPRRVVRASSDEEDAAGDSECIKESLKEQLFEGAAEAPVEDAQPGPTGPRRGGGRRGRCALKSVTCIIHAL